MNVALSTEYRKIRADGTPARQAYRQAVHRLNDDRADFHPDIDSPMDMTYEGRDYRVETSYDEYVDWADYDPMASLVEDREYDHDGSGVWITGGYIRHLEWATTPYDAMVPEHRIDRGEAGLWYVDTGQTVAEWADYLHKRGMAKGPAREKAEAGYRERGQTMAEVFAGLGASAIVATVTDIESGHSNSCGLWYEYLTDDAYLRDIAEECADQAEYERVEDEYRLGPAQTAVVEMAKAVTA